MHRSYLNLLKFYAFISLLLSCLLGMGSGCFAQDTVGSQRDNPGQKCGIENCHGLDIKCGPNPPEMCTAMYGLGDFCRQYVRCEIREGQCQLVEDPKFDACRSCVEKCQNPNDPIDAFGCEAECREKME